MEDMKVMIIAEIVMTITDTDMIMMMTEITIAAVLSATVVTMAGKMTEMIAIDAESASAVNHAADADAEIMAGTNTADVRSVDAVMITIATQRMLVK
jgi:hypothetical protein